MMRRGRFAMAMAAVATSAAVAGGVYAAGGTPEEQALEPSRPAASKDVEKRVDALLRKMTTKEKLQQVQLLSDGQMNEEGGARGDREAKAGVGGVFSLVDPREDQRVPEGRGGGVEARDPDPVRLRHDPRLPHDLPDPAGHRQLVRPERGLRGPPVRRPGVGRRRPQADLQPDGRRLARAALGPHLRGRRRGPVPELRHGRRAREGGAGPELRGLRQGRHQRQALRRLRPAGGRARLQHDRHVRAAAAEPLPAAVQGRHRRRLGHRDVLVQRHQRRPGLRQQAARDRHPQEGMGLRRLHRERLHGRRRAAPPRHGRLAGRRGRPGAQRRHGLRDGLHVHPRQRQGAARAAARSR